MLARESIDSVLNQVNVEDELKQQLQLVVDIRRFSVKQLGLPDNDSYSSYVALDREFPVWTVVATEEFSIDAMSWCYPIIGCASYRGYFSEQDAIDYSNSLVDKHYETSIGGAPAYSTLGWFNDPILPSMLRYGETNLIESIFHELAHQQLYVKDDSAFNEAFATVVGEQGTILWLSKFQPELLHEYQQRLAARDDFSGLVERTKTKLEQLYASNHNQETMRNNKVSIFNALLDEYDSLKQSKWQNLTWFDGWFEQSINNARLAAFSTYREKVPQILSVLESCNFDFVKFYQNIETGSKSCNADKD